MEEMILIFIRQALKHLLDKPKSGTDDTLTGVLLTPMGNFAGIREPQLQLLQIPFVTETGKVGQVPMKRLYLDHTLDELANSLNIDVQTLLDGSREPIIVAEADSLSVEECCPRYYATTKNEDQIHSLRNLESTVMKCLTDKLDRLPSEIIEGWKDNVLDPIFERAKSVLRDRTT